MITLVNPLAEEYALAHSSKQDALLQEVADYTTTHHSKSHMMSSAVQGLLLTFISTLVKPMHILDVGTFTGYSALCLAKGLAINGELHTIECREEDANIAQGFFQKSHFTSHIKLHIGDAINVIPTLNYTWDLVFIDADKVNYNNYYDLILPSVRKGGIIIVDNVLFHGQVLEATLKGKNAKAIADFNAKVANDSRVEKVLLTVRDGLLLLLKK